MERRRRRLQDAKSVSVKRRHGAMPAWAVSAGEVAIRACCRCLFLLLLVAAAAPGRCCRWTRVHTHAAEYPSVSPARGKVVSNGQEARSLVYAPLGSSVANQTLVESFRPTGSSPISYRPYLAIIRVCFPNMTEKYATIFPPFSLRLPFQLLAV